MLSTISLAKTNKDLRLDNLAILFSKYNTLSGQPFEVFYCAQYYPILAFVKDSYEIKMNLF
jgi:hypothetical protein